MSLDGRLRLRVALPLFFLVGAGALIVETTWMRWLRSLMGATAPAVSAALVALTFGQFLGALLGARIAGRSSNPLRAFGVLQLVAVACALLVEPSLEVATRLVDSTGASSAGWLTTSRLIASVLTTLPASAAIGAAFPLLVAATSERTDELGPRGTALYAADLAGAALGAGLTAFWLPALLGVRGGYIAGVVALGVAGVISMVLAGRGDTIPSAAASDTSSTWPRLGTTLIGFGSGFGVFAAQLLFHQAFGRVLDQSTFALGAVLVTTLLSLAVGALVVSLAQRRVSSENMLAGAAVLAASGFLLFPTLFTSATDGLAYVVSTAESATYVPRALLLCAITAGPALVAAAAVLPALFVRAGRDAEGDGRTAGHLAGGLVAANTLGAMTGALAAPYLLLPYLHLWPSFAVLGVVYAAIGIIATRPRRYGVLVAAAVGVVCVLAQPWAHPPLRLGLGEELLSTEVSAAGLVAVIEREGELLIQTDNHYALGGTADAAHQERQGHLPLLLHPAPRRVAFVGTATGSSAGVAFDHEVRELVTVEIMPGVTDAATRFFGRWNSGVYTDARTRVVADDVRSFLRRGTDRFDVIVADLFVPWRSETGSLYTQEHFTRVKERLAPGGLFCQWLPLYQLGIPELESILATFLEVFPDGQMFRGDFFGAHAIIALIGGGGEDGNQLAKEGRAEWLRARGVDDRWVTHRLGLAALYVGPLSALSSALEGVPLNTENRPVVEFASARNPSRHAGRSDWSAAGEPFLRLSRIIRRSEDWRSSRVALEAQRASTGGYLLQAASTYWGAGRSDDATRALNEAAKLLPRALLADAPADRTAADVWHAKP
jgi:spermidine synthase